MTLKINQEKKLLVFHFCHSIKLPKKSKLHLKKFLNPEYCSNPDTEHESQGNHQESKPEPTDDTVYKKMENLTVKHVDDDNKSNLTVQSNLGIHSNRSEYGDDFPDHPEEEYYRQQECNNNRRLHNHTNNSFVDYETPRPFVLSRKNMGIKNSSSQVGLCVNGEADTKIDFDHTDHESHVGYGYEHEKIGSPIDFHEMNAKSLAVAEDDDTSSISARVANSHTDKGYFDLKFYHNRLW